MDYFKKQLDLLQIEKQEDLKLYQKSVESSSVAERRENGWSWYPISIKGTEIGQGDYLTVEIERPSHHDLAHQFRSGSSVVLFSNLDAKNDRIEGVISYLIGNKLKMNLRVDDLPEWTRNGKLGVDLLFDNNSYDEMEDALKKASTLNKNEIKNSLIDILIGEKKPTFKQRTPSFVAPTLNNSQQEALNKIISANELAIVHGPPGTGKTTTIVQAIKALIKQNHKQILVVAPSNTAVDLLSEKLDREGLNVLRIGNPARVSEAQSSLTLESKMALHSQMKEIKKLRKQANEFKNMAHKYKRNFGKAEREQRKALFDEAHKIMKDVGKTEEYIFSDIIAKAQVITATLVGSNHYTIKNLTFDTVVIDEAGQALEPACWIPILKSKKVVLAGDHFQLAPTIKSNKAAKNGLSTTLLEKCAIQHPEAVILLQEQYRMNTAIMGFSSQKFYADKLIAHPTVANRVLFAGDAPLTFLDTAGCGFEEKLNGTSSTNPEEAVFLCKHLALLVHELNLHYTKENFPSIAVISPYKQQVNLLKEYLLAIPNMQEYGKKIAANTIDSFQGQERDVVYISMTRSNSEGVIGFLSDIRRMNVAMTRARKKLVIVGDSATLSQFPFYADFINYAEKLNAYESAWTFMDV
jgi:ATP-dependent RNA/DNA helicase IGHMBP2